jgi:ribosomal protein S18 acetylase RimI-like enzyme
MTPIQVRPGEAEDSLGIAKAHVLAWRETYSGIVPQAHLDELSIEKREAAWAQSLAQKRAHYALHVACLGQEIIGFVDGGSARESHWFQAELYAIYLLKKYQGQGIGKKLLKELMRSFEQFELKSFYVKVLKANPSTGFYRAMGGKLTQTIEIEIGGRILPEEIYGWNTLSDVAE